MDVFRLIGSAVCHQSAGRTLTALNEPLPLCARCTGIYLGIACAVLCLFLTGKLRTSGFPLKTAALPLLVGPALNLMDVVMSTLGAPESGGNVRRLILGAALGSSVVYFLTPACNRLFGRAVTNDPSVKSPLEAIGAVTVSVVATMAVALEGTTVAIVAGMISVGILFALVAVANLAAVLAFSRYGRTGLGPISLAAALALGEFACGCAIRMGIMALRR